MHIFTRNGSSATRLLTALFAFAAFICLLATCPTASAQATGQVSGIVSDPTGAAIPNATVSIRNTGTNAVRSDVSSAAGLYTFSGLQPAVYELTASLSGFATFKATIEVTVGAHATLDAKLAVSNASTSVEVDAGAAVLVNTTSQEISQVVDNTQLSQLPSLTRNPYDFVALSGNISAGDNTAAGNVQNGANRGVNFSLNGQRNSGTEILLDGVENITVFGDAVGITVPIDSVQEYRILTNNFGAEYGRASGGVVSVVTKSGSNAFHGTGWEFNRLGVTTANTVTNAQSGVPKGNYTRNQFGGAVGGPIIKDKLFFFGSTEFTRVRSAANQISVIPNAALLALTPANVQSFFSTYSGTNKYTVLSTTTNIQAGPLNPTTNAPTDLYTGAGFTDSTPLFDNVGFTSPTDAGGGLPQNTYNITGRVDYNLNPKTQAFFRYVNYHEIDQSGAASSSPYAQYNVGQSNLGTAYLLSVAHEFNSSLSTISKASFSRFNTSLTYDTAVAQIPSLVVSGGGAADPNTGNLFQFPGTYSETPGDGGLPFGGPQNTIQFNQDVDYTKGRHQFQGGAQILYIQENNAFGAYAQAIEQLGVGTSDGLANLVTGNLFEYQAAINPNGATPCAEDPYTGALEQTPACTINLPATQPSFARSDRFHDWAAYGQDQWKATSKLTVDYGVRYEYYGVQHNNNRNLDSNFYYGPGTSIPEEVRTGSVLTTPNSPIKKLWNPQYGTVSPRVGFALDVFGDGKTSIRGGYGISYERNFGNVTFNVIQNPPNYAVVVINNTPVTNSNAGPFGAAGAPVALPPTSLRHVDQNIRTAQTQFHSLAIDHQLGHGSAFEISYNGARGIHLYDIKNYNIAGSGNVYLGDPLNDPLAEPGAAPALTFANPHFKNDNNRGSEGDSYYNAINAQFTVQDLHHSGLSLVANYTFAHALDDLSTTFSETSAGNFTLGYTDPYNPALDHGNSDFDIRQRLVVAPIYKTPYFNKGSSGYLKELLGGYEVTGIYTVRTGTPFTLYDSTNDNSGYSIPRYTPSTPISKHTFKSIPSGVNGGGSNSYQLGALPTAVPIYNPVVMGYSDFGPYNGMTQRNSFRGPGAYNFDASLSKTFPIHERLNLELRAEGFDVTNHHNLYIQGGTLDVAQQGSSSFFMNDVPVAPGAPSQSDPNGGSPYFTGTTYPVLARKGGVSGGAGDERRFLQFAGKINF